MERFREVMARGLVPLLELFKRFETGEIELPIFARLLSRLLLGQAAQIEAEQALHRLGCRLLYVRLAR